MHLDRKLIKNQAKSLMKGKVFALFVISIVFVLITAGFGVAEASISQEGDYQKANGKYSDNFSDYFNNNDNNDNNSGDFSQYFGSQGGSSSEDNPIENFGGMITAPTAAVTASSTLGNYSKAAVLSLIAFVLSVAGFVLSATVIAYKGFYVDFVKTGAAVDIGGAIAGIFRQTFSKTFWKKLLLVFLRTLFTSLLAMLLIVPGIVYYYSTQFSYQLMADNPNLSPIEALKLSRKIIEGYRSELFVLDLSFIAWGILCVCTCGLAWIYVGPYYETVEALYYQNFRMRALSMGKVKDDDFLSQEERFAKYGAPQGAPFYGAYTNPNQYQYNPNEYNANGYNPNGYNPNANPQYNQYYNPQQPPYSGYQQNSQPYYQPNQQQGTYQAPPYSQPNQQSAQQPNAAPDSESNVEK